MGIYITGIEMPKDGNFVELLIWADGHVTKTGDSYIAEDGRAYYQPCTFEYFQAIPVPPHGRLIDADELIERAYRLKLDSRELIVEMINNAPTIIPASEGKA